MNRHIHCSAQFAGKHVKCRATRFGKLAAKCINPRLRFEFDLFDRRNIEAFSHRPAKRIIKRFEGNPSECKYPWCWEEDVHRQEQSTHYRNQEQAKPLTKYTQQGTC